MKIKSLEHIKFLLVTLLVLASCANSIGQIIEITTDIPEFSPPSPNAYQIGRFGQVPVNESTGAINYSIPLHTYKVGDITVPVTLNYSGNGVKVDQSSSLTGINWTLMAGGVIIREVRDREDKIASNRYFFEIDELNALPNAWNLDQGVWANTINEMVNDVTADSEVDIYSFNFSSYSGSFFFDQDMNPHLVNYNTELKISRIYDNDNHLVIKITTPDGFNYFFGGTKGSEYTTTRKFHVDPGTETNLQTALYLYKIISPKGSIVEFDYFHLIYEIETGQSFISINDLGKDCQFSNIDNTNTTGDRYLTYFNNGQAILRKIYSNLSNDSIVFYNSALQIDSIAYFNNNGKKYKSNQLIYQYPHDENGVINSRFFLTNVKEKDSANCFTGNNYKMSYDRLNLLPKQFALAQDYFGYYNGIYSTTLIPKGISSFLDSREGSGYADREPDFNFAKIGSLSSIEYPTGGISEFEYESGQGGYKYTNDPITLNTYSYNSSNESLYSVYTNEGLYFSPIVTDSIIIELSSYASERVLRAQFAELIVTNLTDNIQFFYSIGIGSLHEPGSYSNNNNFFKCKTLKNKLYKFELIMDSGDSNQQGTYTSATAKIKYFIPKDALGLRIKRITEKAEPNTNLGYIKRFYYNKKENINDTVIQEYNTQFYLFLEDNITYCEFEEIPFWAHIYRTSLYSSSILDVYVDDSHKNLYPNVTISYGGDNFENGGEELEFKVTKEPFAEIYKEPFGEKSVGSRIFTSSRGNKAWDNGTLLRKRVFKKENGIFKILKDEKYCYKIDASKSFSITNYVGKKTKFQGLVNPSGVHNISLNSYNCYSTWNSLDSIVKIDYFGTDSIVTYQKIYYDIGIPGLPTRVVTKDSKSNQLTSKTYYPDNANLINGITSQELSTIDSMRRNNLHMINSPIQTEQLRNESILNATRVIYKNWGQNFSQTGPLILPDTIKVSGEITNPYLLEARVKYYRYDTLGNPLEFSKVDDSHTVLLWGYNSLNPIAKIQNATYDEVQAILGQEIISQLASSFDNVFIENQIAITRTALPDAMITTFIYNPSVGLIKQIDPNGIISKYEYDSFGRLKFIKDHDGNVLKSYDYHYSGQTPTDNFFTYTVTFDLQGEDSLPKLTTPAGIIISPDDPTRTGYTFEGWYKEAACTNAWNFATDLVTTNVTLYARWTANTYAITYTLNGGTNSPSNTATYTYGVGLTLSSPSRTGYTFGGWYLEPTFVNAISTISTTATGDKALYAKWTVRSFNVTYNANGSTSGSVPTDGAHTYNSSVTVLANTGGLAKTGCFFAGWNTAANGSGTTYQPGNTFTMGAADVTLYAKWTANTYAITYNLNGGTNSPSNTSTYTYGVGLILSDPSKTGHTFGGWYLEVAFLNMITAISPTATGDKELYAEWTPKTYAITYTLNGGTNSPSNTATYTYGVGLTLSNPSRTGYTFGGWYLEPTFVNAISTISATATGDKALYAKWTVNSYTVTYSANGSTSGSVPTDVAHSYNSSVTVLSNTGNLAKTGYTFAGWNTAANGSGTTYQPGNTFTMGAANVTLYAKWTVNSYNITSSVVGSGGTISPTGVTSVTIESSTTYTITPNSGYVVKDVKVNGTSVGAVTSYTFTGVTASQTITAEFEAIVLNVSTTYMEFGGAGGSQTFTITSNVNWTITKSTWIGLSTTSGSNNASVTVSCSPIVNGMKEGAVTVTGGGITRVIEVLQSNL